MCAKSGIVGKVADFQMYVGRTHPDTTEDDIKSLVKEYTTTGERQDGVILTAVEVLKEMTDTSGRVISKCWKVSFPDSDKDVMMEGSSWPAGWTYRRFFAGRQQQKDIPL